jgi:hypothetical protein
MRGVRMISVVFASMTALEVLVFVNMTGSHQTQVLVQFAWEWGIWVSSFISAMGTCFAITLGGPIPHAAESVGDAAPQHAARATQNRNQYLH